MDTASAKGLLVMVTDLACALRNEQGTAKTLGTKAVGVPELEGRIHAQAFRTRGRAIGIMRHVFVFMALERNGGDSVPVRHRLIDVPASVGGIGCDMGGELIKRDDGALVLGAKRGDIAFIDKRASFPPP